MNWDYNPLFKDNVNYKKEIEEFSKETGLLEELVELIHGTKYVWRLETTGIKNYIIQGHTKEEILKYFKGKPKRKFGFNIITRKWEDPKYQKVKTEGESLSCVYQYYKDKHQERIDNNKWMEQSVFMDKTEVLPWVLEIWDDIDDDYPLSRDDIRGDLLRKGWECNEDPSKNINIGEFMWKLSELPNPMDTMTGEEKETYENFPDVVKVYRGIGVDENDEVKIKPEHGLDIGISWTTDKETSISFCRRKIIWKNMKPILLESKVKKDDILLFLNGRKEFEVIIDPENLKEIKVTNDITLNKDE